MNNRKSIVTLLLVIALLLAANVFLRPGGKRPSAVLTRTLLDADADVVRLVVKRKGSPSAVLEKSGAWRIVQPYSGSADGQAVLKVLDALAFTPVTDIIPEAELLKLGRSRADFALADPVLRVTVVGPTRTTDVSFGGPTATADGVYASVEGLDAVLIVPPELFAAVDQTADGFRRRGLFALDVESVASVDIKRGTEAAVTFVRDDGGWSVGPHRAAAPKVQKFLTDLLSAAAVDFVWPTGASNETERASVALLSACGLEPESAVTVTVKGVDGVKRPISFGKGVDDKVAYAFVQNGTAIVTVPLVLRDEAVQDPALFADTRLFSVDLKAISFFSVADGETTCVLSRDSSGDWSLESPIVASADSRAIEALLARTLTLSSADVVPEKHGLSVCLTTNAVPVAVRREALLDKGRLEDLRSLDMVALDPLLVKRIVRTSGEIGARPTSVTYSRDRRTWDLESAAEGAKVDEKGIADVLAALNPLTAVRVEKLKVPAADLDDYGLDRPFLTVAVDQDREDAVRRNILIGGKTTGGRFATVGSADAVFVLSDETVRRLSSPIVGKE